MFNCFSVMGMLRIIKTDNGPGYTEKSLQSFCNSFSIIHKTGIPYNPQGQGIMEQSHQTLKNVILKLKIGQLYTIKGLPRNVLAHDLFVINFLQLDQSGQSTADRLWHPFTKEPYA